MDAVLCCCLGLVLQDRLAASHTLAWRLSLTLLSGLSHSHTPALTLSIYQRDFLERSGLAYTPVEQQEKEELQEDLRKV